MERMLYEEDPDVVSCLRKSSLTLDFDKSRRATEKGEQLAKRDAGVLQLTSPQLEHIFLDSPMNPVNNQRTPASVPTTTFYQTSTFSKPITQEQLDFGRGFDSALEHIRQKQLSFSSQALPVSVTALSSSDEFPEPCIYTTLTPLNKSQHQPRLQPPVTEEAKYSGPWITTGGSPPGLPAAVQPGVSYLPDVIHRLKEEPQLVPCLGSTPPMSPINLDGQESMRQARKRERNRVAARKCRTKKLEQINHLESRVKELKDQNRSLEDTANTLRCHMDQLQTLMTQHMNCGCHLKLPFPIS